VENDQLLELLGTKFQSNSERQRAIKKMGPQINANSFSEKMWLLFDIYIYILDELDDIFFEKTSAGFQLFFLFWGC